MNKSIETPIAITNVYINKEYVLAVISLHNRGVFMVSVVSDAGDLLHKRFVQLEVGENNLQLPVGFLKKGQYTLSLLKGEQKINQLFVH